MRPTERRAEATDSFPKPLIIKILREMIKMITRISRVSEKPIQ